jgi:hypothetical protein
MALVVIGGIVGFFGALFGLVALDLSWLTAIGIWAAGGPAGALAAVLRLGSQATEAEAGDRPALARVA